MDLQKRSVLDFEATMGFISVDLYQNMKLKTQGKQFDVMARVSGGSKDQQLVDAAGELTRRSSSFSVGYLDEGVDGSVENLRPTKIEGPKPHYPIASRRLREEGEVLVRLCIDSNGEVEKAQVQKSSGYRNLDDSALSALSKWRFLASSQFPNNSLAECFRFPVRFTLES